MHRMTRDLTTTEIHAPFSGEELKVGGDRARLFKSGAERRLLITHEDGKTNLFRLSKVIGGRQREDYVGRELDRDERAIGEEKILPVSYLVFNGTLRYKGYSVLVRERPGLEPGQTWRQTCIFCHNTAPGFVALYDELYGPRAPSFQGSASSEAPPERRFRYEIEDAVGLGAALRDELGRLGVEPRAREPRALLAEAMRQTRERFDERHLVELGIGCEACHGGGRAHAAAPNAVRPSFALTTPLFSVTKADGAPLTPALEISRTCAKCHTVLFSRYPYTWEGGHRHDDPGGSPINSGEARDFLLGDCQTQLSCVNCHAPHASASHARLTAFDGVEGDRVCQSCHQTLATPTALRAHSHHAPNSAGSRCVNCHMPRKNLGLAYELTRYHRIGSPTAKERVERDRPLECALCHGDRSVEQIVLTMERWWNKRYDRGALRRLYGENLGIQPLRAALIGGLPHEQAVAAASAAEQGRRDLLPLVAHVMTNDYPLVRYFAKAAADKLNGSELPVDPSLPREAIVEALERWERTRAGR
jgi:predicted CXXCH cytochrome family protein